MVFEPLARKAFTLGELGRNESRYAGILLDYLVDAGRGILVISPKLFFAEVLLHILEAEHHYLDGLAAHLLPVGDVLVEHFLYLPRVQLVNGVAFIHHDDVSVLYRLLGEKPKPFRKQEYHDEQYNQAGEEAAASDYPADDLLECFFHLYSLFLRYFLAQKYAYEMNNR